MILYQGRTHDSREQSHLLTTLERDINRTLYAGTLKTETVIAALADWGKQILSDPNSSLINSIASEYDPHYISALTGMLTREALTYRIETELGTDFFTPHRTTPPHSLPDILVTRIPLGVLFHIAAGNMDVLPVYSIIEGLLTGNINILKLPQSDHGLTIRLLQQLIELEPQLCDYIYVFDTPSTDIPAMQKMASLADGIVTWGGDDAITSVRHLASPGTRLIEWGHKLSFAYISGYTDKEQELTALAEHIIVTRQLLCSSCQTIFLDTTQTEEVESFCKEFLVYMEQAAKKHLTSSLSTRAEITLRQYCRTLNQIIKQGPAPKEKIFQSSHCTLTACISHTLEASPMFGNCLVKPLPRRHLLTALRRHKNHLQTASIICPESSRPALIRLLTQSGVTRITTPAHMSYPFCGESHDGEYPLCRYTKLINCQ